MKAYITIFITAMSLSSFCQGNAYNEQTIALSKKLKQMDMDLLGSDYYVQDNAFAEGTFSKFKKGEKVIGKITLAGGKTIETDIRFDAQFNQVRCLSTEKTSGYMLSPFEISVGNKVLYRLGNKYKNCGSYYYEMIYNGQFQVFRRLKANSPFTNLDQELKHSNEYFTLMDDRLLYIGEYNVFYKKMANKGYGSVKSLIKEEAIDLTSENDVKKLFQNFDSKNFISFE